MELTKGENTITASRNIDLSESGLNAGNTEIVKSIGVSKSWKPKGKLNSLQSLEQGKSYVIVAKKDFEATKL